MFRSCLLATCVTILCLHPLCAQIEDSLVIEQGQDAELFQYEVSEEDLDERISRLREEISMLDAEELNSRESELRFHYILSQGDESEVAQELDRVRMRQDFYRDYRNYILPHDLADFSRINAFYTKINHLIPRFSDQRFVALVLVKSQMNMLFLQKDYTSFIQKYEEHQGLFSADDDELSFQLTEAYLETGLQHKALETARSLYEAWPDDADAFLNYSHTLIAAREYAELEFYLDRILLFEDALSILHLARFQYSRGNTADASALVVFLDEWIQESLENDFNIQINDFKWNFNRTDIEIGVSGGAFGRPQILEPEDLAELAAYIYIYNESVSCRFFKYAYISTFSALQHLFLPDDAAALMTPSQFERYMKNAKARQALIESLQRSILAKKCD